MSSSTTSMEDDFNSSCNIVVDREDSGVGLTIGSYTTSSDFPMTNFGHKTTDDEFPRDTTTTKDDDEFYIFGTRNIPPRRTSMYTSPSTITHPAAAAAAMAKRSISIAGIRYNPSAAVAATAPTITTTTTKRAHFAERQVDSRASFHVRKRSSVFGPAAATATDLYKKRASLAVPTITNRKASVTKYKHRSSVSSMSRHNYRRQFSHSSSHRSSSVYRIGSLSYDKRMSFPGEIVNKRASVAFNLAMPFRKPKTLYENIMDWSLVTATHGPYYVFELNVSHKSHIFWAFTFLGLFSLGLYMIGLAYIGWRDSPVLTAVVTNALDIAEIEFPAVTICGMGALKSKVDNSRRDDSVSMEEMAAMLSSRDPNEYIRAQILVNGYDGCNSREDTVENDTLLSAELGGICNNLSGDSVAEICYEYSTRVVSHDEAFGVCWDKVASMFYPYSDKQLFGIIELIEQGMLPVLKDGQPFWVDLTRTPDGDGGYILYNGKKLGNSTFHFLNLTNSRIDDPTQRCFVMSYSDKLSLFLGSQASCASSHPSLCYSRFPGYRNCSTSDNNIQQKKQHQPRRRILDPLVRLNMNTDVVHKRKKYYKAFRAKDMNYSRLLELIWRSQLPCTGEGNNSMLRQCRWKGLEVPCSSIFVSVPTEKGICCAFNIRSDLFKDSAYLNTVNRLQEEDRKDSPGLPLWYKAASEPKSRAGEGLSVTLDAHTDLIASSSVGADFRGFTATVDSRHSGFPYPSKRNGFRISPGKVTVVAMSAIDIKSSDLESLSVEDRKCFFPHEKELKILKEYSQSGCILECRMEYILDKMGKVGVPPCVPWHMPAMANDTKMCDPWGALAFTELLETMPKGNCAKCLPDCESTVYEKYVTTAPLNAKGEIRVDVGDDGVYFGNVSYDAMVEDVAVVHFHFDSSNAFLFVRQPRLTAVDFVAQVGGLLGACVGFSLCMAAEALYWFFCRLWVDIKTNPF